VDVFGYFGDLRSQLELQVSQRAIFFDYKQGRAMLLKPEVVCSALAQMGDVCSLTNSESCRVNCCVDALRLRLLCDAFLVPILCLLLLHFVESADLRGEDFHLDSLD